MTLIEAIKSGLRFKRKGWDVWTSIHGNAVCQPGLTRGLHQAHVSYADLLADDWEIQEPSVTITRAQFWEAVTAERNARMQLDEMGPFLVGIARRLGLGD